MHTVILYSIVGDADEVKKYLFGSIKGGCNYRIDRLSSD